MKNPWLISQKPDPLAELRLFCFPFAGGGAAAYHTWLRDAPPRLHVCAVEYPGRGCRIAEDPYRSVPALVRHLADLLEPMLDERFAFFGHSMGGLVAFELTRILREHGAPMPRHLFISATAAPGRPRTRRTLHHATDEDVLDELRELGGTPRELLADRELMALAVRTLRADYTALGTYEYRDGEPIDVPTTILGGRSDTVVPTADLRGWREHIASEFRFQLFPGDHFYLYSAAADILRIVLDTLDTHPKAATPI